MAKFTHCAGAVALLSFIAGSAFGTSTMESAFALPQWSEPCSLPSVTAHSAIMHDNYVQPVSDEQPAVANSECGSTSASCNDCNGCASCGSCCCCDQWNVSAGAVILHRNRPSAGPILVPIVFGNTVVDASDFDYGWNGGPDVTVGRQIDCCNSWEVRYFNDIGAGASETLSFPTEDFRIATGTPIGITGMTAVADTDLHSFEFNLRRTLSNNITVIGGFRYLELDDRFGCDLSSGAQYGWGENNHLYGGQLGTDLLLCGDANSFHVDSVFKGGLYGVASKNNYLNVPAAGPNVTGTTSSGDVAFVGEIDLLGTYPICNHVALQGGYQLLWLDGVALATDQAVNATANASGAGIDTNGSLFYHGATMALVFTW